VEAGCPWHLDTTSAAARSGHLECLRFAVEAGCPWSAGTTWAAALNGHLDCLRYAVEAGCPCSAYAIGAAAHNGHLECLRFALLGAVQPCWSINGITTRDKRCLDWLAEARAAANAIKAAWKASRRRRVVTLALCMGRLLPSGVAAIVVGLA